MRTVKSNLQKCELPQLAFLAGELTNWTGGIDFLRFCINGINSVASVPEWHILLPGRGKLRSVTGAIRTSVLSRLGKPIEVLSIASRMDLLNDVAKSIDSQVNIVRCPESIRGIAEAMRRLGSDVLFPCTHSMRPCFPFGSVGYIPDLQHKRLPQFFSDKERRYRDRKFGKLLADASAVVVNAKTVIQDIEEFFPETRAKLFALPFCPPVLVSSFSPNWAERLRSYDLPDKYFLISNQFWKHKSHETAFKALKIIHREGYDDVHIVCTGNTKDYRWPAHFNNLCQGLAQDNLLEYVHFLGVVPKLDQLAIMRRSLAVIQPTLFEGGPGGGAVYDAVATATPAILSDIAVNREVDLGVTDFFKVGSPEDLANRMINNLRFPPERLSAESTLSMLRDRQRLMGNALLEALQFASAAKRSNAP